MTRFIVALSMLVLCSLLLPVAAQETGRQPSEDSRQVERGERPGRSGRLERRERLRDRFGRDGVHLRVFRNYTLPEDATATEPVVVLGGSAQIDGHAEDDVVVVGGSLHLGPKAVVDGNVVTVGGEVVMDSGASVRGSIDEGAIPWPTISLDPDWRSSGWWTALAVGGSVARLVFVLMIAVAVTLVAPAWIGTIAGRPATTSGLLGLTMEVLFVPALVILIAVLVVSIIGIPLLATIPFLLAAFGVIWVAGFTGVAVRLGARLRGTRATAQPSVTDLLVGYAAIVGVTVVGHVLALGLGWVSPMVWPVRVAGLAIEYVAWTIGLGAALASLFASPRVIPPPFPAQSGL